MSKQWINNNGNYYFNDIPTVTEKLPNGVYELNFDGFTKQFFLARISDNFELPEKVYGIEDGLVNRIITTFTKLNKNFGALLKGLKGTGKTIVAKQVCNQLGIPVILINHAYDNLGQFLNGISQDTILFFDEFEKTYELNRYSDEDDESSSGKKGIGHLLTLMDGVFTSKYKRLFLLTTNKTFLPDALISRPSRIRYVKEFNDLSYEHILEVLNDSVENKELIPQLADLLKELKIITVDIVKSVAEEANLYNTADKEFFEIFNVSREEDAKNLVEIFEPTEVGGESVEKMICEDPKIQLESLYEGYNLRLRGIPALGTVEDINYDEGTFTTRDKKTDQVRTFAFRSAIFVHKNMSAYAYPL